MGYNGWKNFQTWNVALWVGNDEGLYDIAKECDSYRHFVSTIRGQFESVDTWKASSAKYSGIRAMHSTPDGVKWQDDRLDHTALDEMIAEL